MIEHIICPQCETLDHCSRHGCIPLTDEAYELDAYNQVNGVIKWACIFLAVLCFVGVLALSMVMR